MTGGDDAKGGGLDWAAAYQRLTRLAATTEAATTTDPEREAVALEFGVPYAPSRHFIVRDVEPNGTAASAGLRDGDVLLRINDTPVGPDESIATRYALQRYVREAPAGSPVAFDILRAGVPLEQEGAVRRIPVSEIEVEEEDPAAEAARRRRGRLTELLNRVSAFYEAYLWREDKAAKARAYLAPLMKGEDPPPFRDGLPQYVRLKNVAVAKKLSAQFKV